MPERGIVWVATVLAASVILVAMPAPAGVLVPITPVPGSISMLVTGINDSNVVTGHYETPDHALHGFVGTIDGNYATFDYPTGDTGGRGINNDGYVTGFARPSGKNIFADAFIRKPDGTLIDVAYHKKIGDGYVQGIVKREKFVGEEWYYNDDFDIRVDGYYGKNFKYAKRIVLPFDTDQTRPRGYNKKGAIVGYYDDVDNGGHPGFLLKDGAASTIRYPDPRANYVFLEGINNKGIVAGFWTDVAQVTYGAFIYDSSAQVFDVIDVAHMSYLSAQGINSSGIVTITADDSAYLYCMRKKNCPSNAGAAEIEDRWISSRNYVRWVACSNGCLTAAGHLRAPRAAAGTRAALARDSAFRAESGPARKN